MITQLSRDEYAALAPVDRIAAVKEGRVDDVLGRTTSPRLAAIADAQLSIEQYRALPLLDRAEAFRSGRVDDLKTGRK